jgi:hypothetical protein
MTNGASFARFAAMVAWHETPALIVGRCHIMWRAKRRLSNPMSGRDCIGMPSRGCADRAGCNDKSLDARRPSSSFFLLWIKIL